MKTIQKSISVLLILMMVCGLFAIVPFEVGAADYTSGYYKYSVSSGEATITAYTGSASSLSIPSSLGGYTVRKIGNYAFSGNTQLSTVSFPSTLRVIGNGAFSDCNRLSSLTIPNHVTELGTRAFEDCTRLASVSLGNGITKMGEFVFSDCTTLQRVTVASGATLIAARTFDSCESLTSVSLPDSIKTIGSRAFAYCISLPSYTTPAGLTEISDACFLNCESLKSVSIGSNIRTIGDSAFNGTGLTTVTIPNNVYTLEKYCFSKCVDLQTATVGSGVRELESDIFNGCSSLKNVKIASGVPKIGNWMFYGCTSLSSISIPNTITEIGEYAFCSCDSLRSFAIPNSVKAIGSYCFGGCENLATVTIGNSVETIGMEAFTGIPIKTIKIPDSVYYIGGDAFWGCKNLVSAEVGAGIDEMRSSVFGSCKALKTVTFAQGCLHIGGFCFFSDTSLTTVVIPESVIQIGDAKKNSGTVSDKYVFDECPSSLTIYGKAGSFAQTFANATGIKFSTGTPPVAPAAKPAAPTVTLSNKSNGIRADWGKVSGAVKYNVFYRKYGTSSWTSVQTANNYYPLLNLTAGTGYQVQVQSIGANNVSGNYSAVKTLIYVPQVKPTVTLANKSNGIRADWNKMTGATKYVVYYKKTGDSKWSSAETANNYYPLLKLTAGTQYAVQVQPVFNGTKGLYSAVNKLVYIPQVKPALTLSKKSNGIRAEWKAIGGATKYIVYYKKTGDSKWSSAETVNTYYPLLKLTRGVNYAVQVQAVFNGTKGLYSAVAKMTY